MPSWSTTKRRHPCAPLRRAAPGTPSLPGPASQDLNPPFSSYEDLERRFQALRRPNSIINFSSGSRVNMNESRSTEAAENIAAEVRGHWSAWERKFSDDRGKEALEDRVKGD